MPNLQDLLMSSSICTPTHAISDGSLTKCDEIISKEDSSIGTCTEKACAEGSLTVEWFSVEWGRQPTQTMKEGAGD